MPGTTILLNPMSLFDRNVSTKGFQPLTSSKSRISTLSPYSKFSMDVKRTLYPINMKGRGNSNPLSCTWRNRLFVHLTKSSILHSPSLYPIKTHILIFSNTCWPAKGSELVSEVRCKVYRHERRWTCGLIPPRLRARITTPVLRTYPSRRNDTIQWP